MSVGIPSDEVAEDYKSSLEDLVDNSRLVINNLTVIAKENIEHAMAISRVLENHIKTTPPNRKLPALYLLDSIVKNVGTPYTLFFGRNLYSTFMNAYSLVNPFIRQKLDEMLATWKLPNAGSLDTKPVFPPDTTRPIEEALSKARAAASEQHRQQQLRAQQEIISRGRQMPHANGAWKSTPTPPQVNGQYQPPPAQQYPPQRYQQQSIPSGQYQQPLPQYPQSIQYQPPPSATPAHQQPYQTSSTKPQYTPPVDLASLHRDIDELIVAARAEFAASPYDLSIQTRLKALLDLQTLLRQQYHPPEQLQQVRSQVTQLKNASRPPPVASVPTSSFYTSTPPQHLAQYHPPPSQAPPSQQIPAQTSTPQPVDFQALLSSNNLANIIANVQKSPSTPPTHHEPIPPTPSSIPVAGSTGGGAVDLLASLRAKGLLGPSTGSPIPAAQPAPYGTPPFVNAGLVHPGPVNDVQLTSASLKMPRPQLISLLYDARPNQCTTCGRRFLATEEGRERKRRHYDWHFRTNQRMNDASKRAQNRSWYVDELEWIKSRDDPEGNPTDSSISAATGGLNITTSATDPKTIHIPVPTDQTLANQPCPICQEKFTASYNDEVSDWVWMDAIKIGPRVYHASCHSEIKKISSRENTPVRTMTPDSVLGKRKAVEGISSASAKMVRA
ncbi:MAG: hypothetical protein Q9217_006221 [Psora testacea]